MTDAHVERAVIENDVEASHGSGVPSHFTSELSAQLMAEVVPSLS
jgi:hypothetical protein